MEADFRRFSNDDPATQDSARFHHCILLRFSGDSVRYDEEKTGRFWSYARQFNDTTYNRRATPSMTYAYSNDFVSFGLVSDRAYDAAHPAGASLGDIAQLYYQTAWPYVSSGYKDCGVLVPEEWFSYQRWNESFYKSNFYTYVAKYLQDLTPEDLKLIEPFRIGIRFTVPPAEKGQHNLTLTVWDRDRSFTQTVPALIDPVGGE